MIDNDMILLSLQNVSQTAKRKLPEWAVPPRASISGAASAKKNKRKKGLFM